MLVSLAGVVKHEKKNCTNTGCLFRIGALVFDKVLSGETLFHRIGALLNGYTRLPPHCRKPRNSTGIRAQVCRICVNFQATRTVVDDWK